MYSCGPTVYRYAHVGNLRTFLLADLVRRVVLYHGIPVLHVQNITDVGHLRDERFDRGEDRMLVAAGLEHKTTAEIADAYEAAFHADAALLNLLPAHVYPRATEHVPEMLELAERLVDTGHAYVSEPATSTTTSRPGRPTGRLSGNTSMRCGPGIAATSRRQARLGGLRALEGRRRGPDAEMATDRWGEGFPGWHLECSAMAMKHLGPRFDLHSGGIDNVFRITRTRSPSPPRSSADRPARTWVHGEFLRVGGKKMAKSAGNIDRIADVAERGVDPLAFRLLCLTSRYRHKLEYTDESLAAAAAGLASLRAGLAALGPAPAGGPWAAPAVLRAGAAPARPLGTADGIAGNGDGSGPEPEDRAHAPAAPLSDAGRALHDRFVAAIDDDLDLPTAVAVVREMLRADLPADERRWLVLDADFVLGLDLDRAAAVRCGTPGVVRGPPGRGRPPRRRARGGRAARDFARSDAIRTQLAELGYEVTDGPDGQTLRRR